MRENLQPLIDYAKTEYIRLLIEVDKSGYIVLYCDKTERRNFLKQIRLNNIKTRIKIVTYDYNIMFPEIPALTNLDYLAGKIKKTFRKERIINVYSKWTPQKLYNIVLVDFEEYYRDGLIRDLKNQYFDTVEDLKERLNLHGINASVNRDRNTFIIYYMDKLS